MKLGKLNIDPLLMCVIKKGRKLRPSKESLTRFAKRLKQLLAYARAGARAGQGGNSVENGKWKMILI
ncbi:MAG TPA: hypothetical protein DD381_11235 [Lentisphaeria bacterium]|nr:MAG: hypothetical protein A2X47_03750 [Lentisphaerae bacterium GWF2_38_69]HBM16902.1 hypothetical protein [Lentisphaeria bacterium]